LKQLVESGFDVMAGSLPWNKRQKNVLACRINGLCNPAPIVHLNPGGMMGSCENSPVQLIEFPPCLKVNLNGIQRGDGHHGVQYSITTEFLESFDVNSGV
jgi:hypothetical protein